MFVFEFVEALFVFEYATLALALALLFERPNTRPHKILYLVNRI